MRKGILNTPSANILMNSLRAIGYSFEASIADIMDNSISAKANNIYIDFPPNDKNIYISIADDGLGMNENELLEAMRYGSKHKNSIRNVEDLGRFGLGLKSASLSQCRVLTVVSKKNDKVNAYRWDLNYIEETNEWNVLQLEQSEIGTLPNIHRFNQQKTGTLVIWEDFDLIQKSSGGLAYSELLNKLDQTNKHISLVFHRFLNGTGVKKVDMFLNDRLIDGLDPFLEDNKKTDIKKKRSIAINDFFGMEHHVIVQPVILPFQKDLTKRDIDRLGGIEELNTNQGFYVYRANRLLIWGTWFRMQFNHELNKYARIKVDIPNSLDDIWDIDVKKQNAKLPSIIRSKLKSSIEDVINGSKRKNKHRASLTTGSNVENLWERYQTRNETFIYKIKKNSFLMKNLEEKVPENSFRLFLDTLEIIEAALPYHSIYTDVSVNKVEDELDDENIARTLNYAKTMISSLSKINNESTIEIVNRLILVAPFNDEKIVKKLIKEYSNGS